VIDESVFHDDYAMESDGKYFEILRIFNICKGLAPKRTSI